MNTTANEITAELFKLGDSKYKRFTERIIPTLPPQKIIGVRMPTLRKYSKSLRGTSAASEFLSALPHTYLEEDNLHMLLLGYITDFEECVRLTDAFLPYVDNWATCDIPIPKVFAKNRRLLLPHIDNWINTGAEFTVRYAVGLLMRLFLDDEFDPKYLEIAASITSDHYYTNMMIAWYFATALTKQYDCAVKYIEQKKLSPFVLKKTIQKARDSSFFHNAP